MEIPVPEEFKPLVANFHTRKEYMRRGVRLPYVLFGFQVEQLEGPPTERKAVKRPALHMLDCSSCSGQKAILDQYALQKGFQVLEYSFPKGPEPEVAKDRIGVPRLANPDTFQELERTIFGYLAINRAEIAEAKNAAMEAEIEKLKAEKDEGGAKRGK